MKNLKDILVIVSCIVILAFGLVFVARILKNKPVKTRRQELADSLNYYQNKREEHRDSAALYEHLTKQTREKYNSVLHADTNELNMLRARLRSQVREGVAGQLDTLRNVEAGRP